jgi:hypothetical protein
VGASGGGENERGEQGQEREGGGEPRRGGRRGTTGVSVIHLHRGGCGAVTLEPASHAGVAARTLEDAQDAPSFFTASRKFFTVALGALRPSSFSPWRLTQITGTFIFSTGAMSVV